MAGKSKVVTKIRENFFFVLERTDNSGLLENSLLLVRSMSTRSWALLACLLIVSVVHGQLYLSPNGSLTSTNCNETLPCQNLAQLMQVYHQGPLSPLTIRWAAGDYYGENNTNIRLPGNTTSTIELWTNFPGSVSVGKQNDNLAVFTAFDDATVIFQGFSALNCLSLRLLDVNNTVSGTTIVHLLGGTFSSEGTVLQSNEPSGDLLLIQNARIRGIVNANFESVQWMDSMFDHTVGLDVNQGTVTGCTFTDNVNVMIEKELTVTTSVVNSSIAGRDITFTYKEGRGLLRIEYSTFTASVTTTEALSVSRGTFLVLTTVTFEGLYTNAILSHANQTTIMNSTISASQRCLQGQANNLALSETTLTGCTLAAVDLTMTTQRDVSVSVEDCGFTNAGPITIQSNGPITGTLKDSTFTNSSGQVLSVSGDWILSGVEVHSSSAPYSSGNEYALYFNQYDWPNSTVVMESCAVTGPLPTNGTLYINQGNAVITKSTFDSLGDAYDEGQIFIAGNSTTVNQCVFKNMGAGGAWGALSVMSTQTLVQDTRFMNLYAHDAAALNIEGETTTVRGCEFTNCSAQGHGGAIVISAANSQTHIESSTFVNCGVDAIWVGQSVDSNTVVNLTSLTFTNCTPYAVDCDSATADLVYTSGSLNVTDGGSTIGSGCAQPSTPGSPGEPAQPPATPDQGSWWQFVLGGIAVILVSICILGAGAGFYIVQSRSQASSYEELA